MSTRHFTGNYPPRCSIRGASLPEKLSPRVGDRIGKAAPQHEIDEISKLSSEVCVKNIILETVKFSHFQRYLIAVNLNEIIL